MITDQSSNQEVRKAVAELEKEFPRLRDQVKAILAYLEAERGASLRAFTTGTQKAAPRDSVAFSNRPKDEPRKWRKVTDKLYAARDGFTVRTEDLTEEQRLEIVDDLGFDPLEGKDKKEEA